MTNHLMNKRHDHHKSKEVAPFLKNLRRMLNSESDEILRWTANGKAFEIHDMHKMMEDVLPKYFKHRKYTSFQRQLNYFHFKKWTKSKALVCTFSNEYFLRDEPDLSWKISRKKSFQLGQEMHNKYPSAAPSPQVNVKRCSDAEQSEINPAKNAWNAYDLPVFVYSNHSKIAGACSNYFSSNNNTESFILDYDMETTINTNIRQSVFRDDDDSSLDWVDNLLPQIDLSGKLDEPTGIDLSNDPFLCNNSSFYSGASLNNYGYLTTAM